MKVLSKLIEIDSGNIEHFKEKLTTNKFLKVVEHSNNVIDVYPKYKSSFPFVSKSKSSLNYYYKFLFNDKKVKVDYVLQKQIYYSLIFEIILIPILVILLFFYPKVLGLLIIFLLALIFSLVSAFISLHKAKLFLRKEILK
jgi:hypothetical protein